ncbi:MAG: hypothetical protein ACLTT1_15335 [[Clostridium] scindens]
MTNARLVCSITKLNFLEWKKNPKIITAFVLAFVFCVMLSGRAIMFANSYDTTMQIFEPLSGFEMAGPSCLHLCFRSSSS